MREILFRAKAINRDKGYHRTNYKNGDWVYGLITRLYDERFEVLPAEMSDINGVSGIEVDYKTIEQYTGVTDKNNNRIFEGDILKFDNAIKNRGVCGISSVIFNNGKFGVIWGFVKDFVCLDGFAYTTMEVIGNIHDNPELLKGGVVNE